MYAGERCEDSVKILHRAGEALTEGRVFPLLAVDALRAVTEPNPKHAKAAKIISQTPVLGRVAHVNSIWRQSAYGRQQSNMGSNPQHMTAMGSGGHKV